MRGTIIAGEFFIGFNGPQRIELDMVPQGAHECVWLAGVIDEAQFIVYRGCI
jgi:hypothetical protein